MFSFSRFLAQNANILIQPAESAKCLVRVSVLEGKLDLCWKLQFAVKDAKIFRTSLDVFVNVFFSIFGTKHKQTSPTSSESAKDLLRMSVLEEKLCLWWKLHLAV